MKNPSSAAPGRPSTGNGAASLSRFARKIPFDVSSLGMIGALIVVMIVGQIIYPAFLTWTNIGIILTQNAPLGIVAVGMTFVMISGGFDLSVGAIYAFAATMFAKIAMDHGLVEAGLCTLLLGIVCGTANGAVVALWRINPFIATLGSASIFSGLAFVYSNSTPQTPDNPNFQILGQAFWGPLPIAVWLLFVTVLLGGFVLSKTVYGQALYAIGGNETAARLSGLRVGLIRGSTFALVGLLSAAAGMIEASRLAVGQADIGGTIPLDAIAVVIIGGTSLLGGEGSIWRTVVGLLILGAITNLFYSLAVDSNVQLVAKGAIVIGAVGLDVWSRRRR
ncbi:ABC transporter permease [Acidisoma silvae]|uniref:ABC transporter permease n=1 Tax=Acidisoma silvae TaxID=2802396 RepID=A0A963YUW5_9PROT|nr:ABC transporter permease [Acidisoma silvae]MCB8877510.1 ABC transporter permease [Acidisoma silvae]